MACRATQPIKVAEKAVHDTLWLQSLHYDSIYVGNDRSLERIADTVYLRERSVEYRYRLLHDSIYICRTDSIPYAVEVVRTVPRPHTWLDKLSHLSLIIILLFIIYKARSYWR